MKSKNIIICFDGTSNHPKDAKQERKWFGLGDIEDNGITNILKLHVLFGGDLKNKAYSDQQHSLYYSGVGSYGNRIQRMFNTAFSPANLDVGRIIKTAKKDLMKIYTPGDKIFIFGFSRGAAIARKFAVKIGEYIEGFPANGGVRFLGVFDTVASMGFPNLDDDKKPISDVVFENGKVSRHVEEALHLVSLDDKRIAFQPTLMNKDHRITEIWFPGAHSDVGGGFWYDGLSDFTLTFMLTELRKRKLGLKILKQENINYKSLRAPNNEYRIDKEDLFIKPNHTAKIHYQDRWFPIARTTLTTRTVRVNKNDKPAPKESPLIHHIAIQRIKDVVDYRPKSLKGVVHSVYHPDGTLTLHHGLNDHISNPSG